MTDFPLSTLAAQVTEAGISAPTFADVRSSLRASFQLIYGSDVYIAPDSQDGQWIDAIAKAISDSNAMAIAVFNAFSPANAQGGGLSSLVKINGIQRAVPTASTVDVTLVGVVGTVIDSGVVSDTAGVKWLLPVQVTIPPAGTITVTATCQTLGAVNAVAHAITKIETPTLGWQTVDNAAAAAPGEPVETDAALRRRQALSTAIASVTPLKGLKGALYDLEGVSELVVYENDSDATDGNGLPSHSIAVVIVGGDSQAIADTILAKKTMGARTVGSTVMSSLDPYGAPFPIRFYRPADKAIDVRVAITAKAGYSSTVGAAIVQAVIDYVNAIPIGDDVVWTRLFLPANLYGGTGSDTFEITGLTICAHGGSLSAADVVVAFNETATTVPANVALVVT